ncbi:MAG: DUF4013 domain-containing protein [Methanoregula sp.]|jgi:hypothetical protein
MDFAEMLGDAFNYSKEGVLGNMNRWLKLILAIICLGLPFSGYLMRIYRGNTPAPEVDEWGTLFIDGLKLFVVGLVYALPIIILWVLVFGVMLLAGFSGSDETSIAAVGLNFLLQMLMFVFEIILAIFLPIAYIRFARTGIFSEAFNFSGILDTIKRIGWINYIVAIVLVSIVVSIPVCILVFIFFIIGGIAVVAAMTMGTIGLVLLFAVLGLGLLTILVILPPLSVFQARYMTRLYDCAVPVEQPVL